MNWRLVARKDFGETFRRYHFHTFVPLFVLLGLVFAYISRETALIPTVIGLNAFLAPVFAVMMSQEAIVDKRSRGELKVLLGLPFTRLEFVFGTVVGRSLFVTTAIVSSLTGAVILALAMGISFSFTQYLASALLLLFTLLAFVSIAVAVSAVSSSSTVSSAGAFGIIILFVFRLWGALPKGVLMAMNGFELPEENPEWVKAFGELNPLSAFSNLLAVVFQDSSPGFAFKIPSGDIPFYETPVFAFVVISFWIVVPLAVAYRRFENTDL